jgi:glycosyltransferase involved in cell wall biosynthesis
MKVLRALATGKPVVTTTLGSEGYMRVGEAAPFVVADTTDAIATATARLLADERLRRDLGERARRFAVRYHSPEAWVARLEAVYHEARDARLRTG